MLLAPGPSVIAPWRALSPSDPLSSAIEAADHFATQWIESAA
jgi:hypothetical protein